jgi:amidase
VPGSFGVAATRAGTLDGLGLAVKDMFAIEGHVSSFGHSRWRETHSAWRYTAPVLGGLLSAGASIAGLAKLDQLARSIVGTAGRAEVGVGPDTGGSIRVPAAACGLYGLRPTRADQHGRRS